MKTAGPIGGGYDIEFPWRRTIPTNAFSGANCLESVTLPDKLLKLGDNVFKDCSSLADLKITDTLEVVGSNVIAGTASLDELGESGSGCKLEIPWKDFFINAFLKNNSCLKNVVLPESVTVIDARLFTRCTGLEQFTIPERITRIERYAFSGCTSLRSVIFPSSLTSIGAYAFQNCTALTQFYLPAGLVSLGSYAFTGCTALETVTVPGCVGAVDGVFSGCTALKEVRISNGATSVGASAFSGCTGLKAVYLPRSVASVGENAFYDCEKLYDVYYSGSETDWAAMEIGSGNGFLTTADIHYSENPVGAAKADVVGVTSARVDGKTVYTVTVYCMPGADAWAYGVRYGANGQMLGLVSLHLAPGKENVLTVAAEDGSSVRIFAVDGESAAPLCATVNLGAVNS